MSLRVNKTQGSNKVALDVGAGRVDGVDAVPGSAIFVQDVSTLETEIYSDATYTYICKRVPGTALSAAANQVKRIVTATGSSVFADRNANFDNVATDLATVQGLTYA